MSRNCCYQCENRTAGCHSTCEAYKVYLDEQEVIKKARAEATAERYTILAKRGRRKRLNE